MNLFFVEHISEKKKLSWKTVFSSGSSSGRFRKSDPDPDKIRICSTGHMSLCAGITLFTADKCKEIARQFAIFFSWILDSSLAFIILFLNIVKDCRSLYNC
jgi:hypothetical protein